MGFVANSSTLSVLVQKCMVNQLKLVEIGCVVINYNYAFCVLGLWQSVTDYMSDMGYSVAKQANVTDRKFKCNMMLWLCCLASTHANAYIKTRAYTDAPICTHTRDRFARRLHTHHHHHHHHHHLLPLPSISRDVLQPSSKKCTPSEIRRDTWHKSYNFTVLFVRKHRWQSHYLSFVWQKTFCLTVYAVLKRKSQL